MWQGNQALWGEFAEKSDSNITCDLRYQGQIHDRETGLYYNRHRYYDSDSCQYLSSDPIGLAGGIRPQSYVADPVNWVDPLGLAKDCCPKGDNSNDWQPKKGNPWNKGKLKEHYEKHGAEFGAKNAQEYSQKAIDFGTRKKDSSLIDLTNGSFKYRYEPSTQTIFVGTSRGKIKTFYKWDGRETDVVINTLKDKGML